MSRADLAEDKLRFFDARCAQTFLRTMLEFSNTLKQCIGAEAVSLTRSVLVTDFE
jgi:hypothetical protein